MEFSEKSDYKRRLQIRCKIISIINKEQPTYCFHNEYHMKRGNFLTIQKLRKCRTELQIRRLQIEHKTKLERETNKYSLSVLTRKIFKKLKKSEIKEVIEDPVFFFRDNEKLLDFIKKRLQTLENKYLKKKRNNYTINLTRSMNTYIDQSYSPKITKTYNQIELSNKK